MQQIEVVARFNDRGNVIPQHFTWKGRSYAVVSTGRRWDNGDGQHILALTSNGQTFELIYVRSENHWYLARSPDWRAIA